MQVEKNRDVGCAPRTIAKDLQQGEWCAERTLRFVVQQNII
jgi:hypothetical protein